MRKQFAISLIILCGAMQLKAQMWTEDFEINSLGIGYFSASVFTNNANAYYNRTTGSDISTTYAAYSQKHGAFIWAGENLNDTNGGGDGLSSKTISFPALSIVGLSNLEFRGLFGSGNPGNGWDYSDELFVQYRIDAGIWIKILQFATPAQSSNSGLFQDTDFDGIGEGVGLNSTLRQFTASIPVMGSTIEFRIVATANGVGEEFAFDYLRLYDLVNSISGCTNPAASNFSPAATTDDGSCTIAGCTDSNALNFYPLANVNDGSCIYSVPSIVINEIHYNASQYAGFSDIDYEFIELHNNTDAAVSLTGWRLSDAVDLTFPPGAVIPANGYVVVARNVATYSGGGFAVYQFTGDLANSSSTILLFENHNILVDEVTYANTPSWPVAADGDGPSLELSNFMIDNADPLNWCTGPNQNGTPGLLNSCYSLIAGCMNPSAANYNPLAQYSDNSCIFPGCTYTGALNYDPTANQDDGSCTFNLMSSCPSDLNNDGVVNITDLLLFMSEFGSICQ